MANQPISVSKTELAKRLGVSRSSLYYHHKRPAIDLETKLQIEAVMTDNPAYGHKRIALGLKLNKKRILRVMKKFGIKPYRRRPVKPKKEADSNKPATKYLNLIEGLCPIVPGCVWASDFTYLRFREKFIYLATTMDLYDREAVGWNISRFHNQELVLGSLNDAFKRQKTKPLYHHSDQGSEYDSQQYLATCEKLNIQISMSRKGHPWENGFQESFYSQFKTDLGRTDQFESLGELVEAIHQTINYYNNKRIHTSLKMPPLQFKKQHYQKQNQKPSDTPFQKEGT